MNYTMTNKKTGVVRPISAFTFFASAFVAFLLMAGMFTLVFVAPVAVVIAGLVQGNFWLVGGGLLFMLFFWRIKFTKK